MFDNFFTIMCLEMRFNSNVKFIFKKEKRENLYHIALFKL